MVWGLDLKPFLLKIRGDDGQEPQKKQGGQTPKGTDGTSVLVKAGAGKKSGKASHLVGECGPYVQEKSV